MKNLFSLREEEISQALKVISDCHFVIIGGYAVNAYTLPRFSVDCDIVVKDDNELEKIEKALLKCGYRKETQAAEIPYAENFLRYEKRLDTNILVSLDILIYAVADRMSGVKFEADWIFENSTVRILKGKTITEELKLRIINIDALLVMKIISCRSTDIRDVFMMFPYAHDKVWIKSEITRRYDFNDRLAKIIEKVSSQQFKDGLSGVYGYIDQAVFEKHKQALLAFQR